MAISHHAAKFLVRIRYGWWTFSDDAFFFDRLFFEAGKRYDTFAVRIQSLADESLFELRKVLENSGKIHTDEFRDLHVIVSRLFTCTGLAFSVYSVYFGDCKISLLRSSCT